jgi:hypothetical protein
MERMKPAPGPQGKLPVPVIALVRGPTVEFPANVVDVSPLGIELTSKRRLMENDRIGLTLKCDAVRGPGVSVHGDVRTVREEPGPSFFVRVEFEHTGDSEKKLQTFLWGLEEAGRKARRR